MIRDIEEYIEELEANLDALKRDFRSVAEDFENLENFQVENSTLEEENARQFRMIEDLKQENQALKNQMEVYKVKLKVFSQLKEIILSETLGSEKR